ncbi:MAG TPA: hypothetical protein VGR47_00420 [Terracidiphilus sp.]|nr:hypothetical protein [Terracidiphilus sp.]
MDPITLASTPAKQSAEVPADAVITPAARMVADFKDGDVKFDMSELVEILRDRKHEGWVLAAYPDPRTRQPLIGAGFSLDLPEREHPQTDPLNQHQFLEPSSADLWQAAGFDPDRLNDILKVFYQRKRKWSKRTWRRRLYSLPAQISDEDATELVRIGAIQAIYNARAYCRNFDRWTGPQQMAITQLVYQMGVNLQHFDEFLAEINSGTESAAGPQLAAMDSATFAPDADAAAIPVDQSPEFWQGVQKSLIGSQWAHKYRTRAIAVIAMLDPAYQDDPSAAEQRVGAVLRPAVVRHRHRHASATRRQVAARRHRGHARKGRTAARVRSGDRA